MLFICQKDIKSKKKLSLLNKQIRHKYIVKVCMKREYLGTKKGTTYYSVRTSDFEPPWKCKYQI